MKSYKQFKVGDLVTLRDGWEKIKPELGSQNEPDWPARDGRKFGVNYRVTKLQGVYIQLGARGAWLNQNQFKLVEENMAKNKFKKGDIVKLIKGGFGVRPEFLGRHFQILDVLDQCGEYRYVVMHPEKRKVDCSECSFELVEEPQFQRFTRHKDYIQALKDTALKYAKCIAEDCAYDFSSDCRLCKTTTGSSHDLETCKDCPWVKITGRVCSTNRNYTQRMTDLYKWVQLYEMDLLLPKRQKKFAPFTVELEISSAAEAATLACLANMSGSALNTAVKAGIPTSNHKFDAIKKVAEQFTKTGSARAVNPLDWYRLNKIVLQHLKDMDD